MIKNIGKIFTSHIIVKLLGLATIVFALQFLSVEDFGKYSFYLVCLNLITIIIDPLLSSYLVDYKHYNFLKYNFGFLIISILLLPVFYIAVLYFFESFDFKIYLLFSGTYFLSAALKSYLNVKERYFDYGIVDILRQLFIFLSTVVVFYGLKNTNYETLLMYNYGSTLVILLLLFYKMVRVHEISFSIHIKAIHHAVKNAKFLILYLVFIPFISFIDSFFVDKYLSSNDLGLYSFSLKIYNFSSMLVIPIFTVLNIEQIKIAKVNNYTSFFKKNLFKVLSIALVLCCLSIFLNWWLVHNVFSSYVSTLWNTTILLFAAFITYISLPFSFLIASRKYKYLFVLAVFAIVFNIVFNLLFIEKYGSFIAALSTLISQVIINLGAAILSYKLFLKKKVK